MMLFLVRVRDAAQKPTGRGGARLEERFPYVSHLRHHPLAIIFKSLCLVNLDRQDRSHCSLLGIEKLR